MNFNQVGIFCIPFWMYAVRQNNVENTDSSVNIENVIAV